MLANMLLSIANRANIMTKNVGSNAGTINKELFIANCYIFELFEVSR